MNILNSIDIIKVYESDSGHKVNALRGCDINIVEGEHNVIIGPSGSGKSTLLNILSLNDFNFSGLLYLKDIEINKLDEHYLLNFKRNKISLFHQNPLQNLFSSLTIEENFKLSSLNSNVPKKLQKQQIEKMAADLLILDQLKTPVYKLSGGECARAALGTLLLKNTSLIYFLDEPTSAIDKHTTIVILKFLKKICREHKKTIVSVTHDLNYLDFADNVYIIRDGKLTSMFNGEAAKEQLNFAAKNKSDLTEFLSYVDSFGHTQIPSEVIHLLKLKKSVLFKIRNEIVYLVNKKRDIIENKKEKPIKDLEIEKFNQLNLLDSIWSNNINSPKLSLDNIEIKYNNNQIISNFNLKAEGGEVVILMGRSGSGKTSILNGIVGEIEFANGTVTINNKIASLESRQNKLKKQNIIKCMPQYFDILPAYNLKQIVNLWNLLSSNTIDRNIIIKKLNVPNIDVSRSDTISQGQLQRFMIGIFLISPPQILLLDEPTAHQDSANVKIILEILLRYVNITNSILVIATHDQRIIHPSFRIIKL